MRWVRIVGLEGDAECGAAGGRDRGAGSNRRGVDLIGNWVQSIYVEIWAHQITGKDRVGSIIQIVALGSIC